MLEPRRVPAIGELPLVEITRALEHDCEAAQPFRVAPISGGPVEQLGVDPHVVPAALQALQHGIQLPSLPGVLRQVLPEHRIGHQAADLPPEAAAHEVLFRDQDGRPGASRTLVLNRSPGLDSDEAQRAAEVVNAALAP